MRQTLQRVGYGFLLLFSIDLVISLLDWAARWEWFNELMARNPHLAAFIRTPFAGVFLLVFGFGCLFAERRLQLPKVIPRYVNSRQLPNLHTTPMKLVFETEAKTPGWDEYKIDWHWLVEVHVVNESDISTTIDDIQAKVRFKSGEVRAMSANQKLDTFHFDGSSKGEGPIPSLMNQLSGVPLARGVGYRGWVRFDVPQISQGDMHNRPSIDIWLKDAFQQKHKAQYRRKSESEWDMTFQIVDLK